MSTRTKGSRTHRHQILVSGRLCRILLLSLALLMLRAEPATAVSFNRVVSLGDSLLDQSYNPWVAPLVSQHLAHRLGASHIQLAEANATTGSLIAMGQHTYAAAHFGPGDLAVLWIGGNDFLNNGFSIQVGDDSFIDSSAANLDIILRTLVQAEIEVLVLNLPDMAILPALTLCLPVPIFPCFSEETLPFVTAASRKWRDRVDELAATHGVAVADIYAFSLALQQDPANFSFLGNVPVIEGDGCELCIFGDWVHPSRLGQAHAANTAILAWNEFFDPEGLAPLETLSEQEIWNVVFDPVFEPFCGDRVVDEGEECDDGNHRGGDCCSPACTTDPVGTPCGDALCYPDSACDGSGVCSLGEELDCSDDVACTRDSCSRGNCIHSPIRPLSRFGICEEDWGRSLLSVRETSPGNESLTLRLRDGPALSQQNFGNPNHEGGTAYDLCVFDDQRTLVAGFIVDRAGQSCGDQECWRAKGDRGWRYKDPEASSHGTRIVDLKGGSERKSQITWSARNDANRGLDTMPTGIAAALEHSREVIVQLTPSDFDVLRPSSDSRCFLKTFTDLERQELDWFKAR